MRHPVPFLISCFLIAAPSFAQTTVTTADAAPAPHATPALLSSTVPAPQDSRLVLAAKRTVAARMRGSRGTTVVIDNLFVQRSHGSISTSSGSTPGPASIGSPSDAPAVGGPASSTAMKVRTGTAASGLDAVAEARRQRALTDEQNRMRVESEQPYGDNVDEDRVTQRLTQIPGEMATPPPPPPQ
jgi:hypothetical protein